MKFIGIGTWEPQHRDAYASKRMEKGRMLPEGIKVIGEWLDVSGGRQIILFEADSAMDCFMWANHWNKIASIESFPVIEVKDDKATELVE